MDTTVREVGSAFEIQGMGQAATAALTDGMVERLVTTASTGMEVLDRLNDPDTKAAVHRLLDGLTAMHTTGALDSVFDLAAMLQAARSAATDDMIERMYHFLETMVNNLATRELAELARDAELSLYEAARCCDGPEAPKTLWGVIRCLSKPETIQTLNLLLAFGCALRERTKEFKGRFEPDLSE